MQSFQCSAFTDVKGIETAFSQCSQIQKKLDPKTCTGVVVLDEIGLAEDSPNMPLKVLLIRSDFNSFQFFSCVLKMLPFRYFTHFLSAGVLTY